MGKKDYIEVLDTIKSKLIALATNGSLEEELYDNFRDLIINEPKFKDMDVKFLSSNQTADDFVRYMRGGFSTYSQRRQFITEKMNALIHRIEESQDFVYVETPWDKVNESAATLINDLNNVSDRMDVNEIGTRCRETIILLANIIYNEKKDRFTGFSNVIPQERIHDFFEAYFNLCFPSKSNEFLRSYAKSCFNLANHVVHSTTATVEKTTIGIIATLSLIQIVSFIEKASFCI